MIFKSKIKNDVIRIPDKVIKTNNKSITIHILFNAILYFKNLFNLG